VRQPTDASFSGTPVAQLRDMDLRENNGFPSNIATHCLASEDYDLVILGDGTGATFAAWTFAGQGQRVAVIERKYVGGSCPNIACLPSKNIIQSARVASYFRRGKEFGSMTDSFDIDMPAVRDRKRTMVSGLNDMYLENFRQSRLQTGQLADSVGPM
jgi:pyruvate/2-oxoglutarate dehydrogenase complex dihydrolipoamide dehydrogenase (E3) component